jgi:8-oxo-dGTP diphosphatase
MAVVRKKGDGYDLLLIQRKRDPFAGKWALPGGFVDMDETVEDAVGRELFEETSLSGIALKQFYTYSAIHRDPRHRTVSVVFVGKAEKNTEPKAGDDAKNARWFSLDDLPALAFDHAEILKDIVNTKIKR